MFVSAGGGGKRVGTNKQSVQQHPPQLQTHQRPSHTKKHQLLQQHITQQHIPKQQIPNNTLIHHNKQISPQSATSSHPLSQTQQTVIVQQKQSPPPPQQSSHQSQYQHNKIPITFLTYQLDNVHATTTANAKVQHRPVQTTVGSVSQMSPSQTGFVRSSNDPINGNRSTGINSGIHYISQTTNSNIMSPTYQLQQNAHLMVTTPYNNVSAATSGNGASQLSTILTGAALYPTTQQSQTPPPQTQQQLLMNPQHALQYFSNNSVPIHSLQHHPQQQIRNMFAMVTPARPQYLISPNCFLPHASPLPPQALTYASPQYQTAAAPVLATVTVNGGTVNTQIQNITQSNAVMVGPTTYGHAQYCTSPLEIPSVGMVEATTFTRNNRAKPHAIKIIHPITGEEVDVRSKKVNKSDERNTVIKPTENSCEQVVEIETQNVCNRISEEITFEDVSVQTEEENSLTASIDSESSEIITHTQSHPAADTDKHDDEKVEMTTSVNDSDNNHHLDEVDLCSSMCAQQAEKIHLNIVNENKRIKVDEECYEELKNIPEINTSTTAVSCNLQSTSGTASLKIYIRAYGDPYDTDADANEHELDDEDLDMDHSKEIECDKSTSHMGDDDSSCTPNKINNDELNQSIINESQTALLSKQTRNSSKKGAKRCKKNKKKSKQQQQNFKISETNNHFNKNVPIKTNNNSALENNNQNKVVSPKSLETKGDTEKHLPNKCRPNAKSAASYMLKILFYFYLFICSSNLNTFYEAFLYKLTKYFYNF